MYLCNMMILIPWLHKHDKGVGHNVAACNILRESVVALKTTQRVSCGIFIAHLYIFIASISTLNERDLIVNEGELITAAYWDFFVNEEK